jgi:predicted ATPase
MRVVRLSVEGLHGLIDASLEFFPDLTIVVGRNGSGKTSVLTLISNMLRLDMNALRETRLKNATLVLEDPKLGSVILSVKNQEKGPGEFTITINNETVGAPLNPQLSLATLAAGDYPATSPVFGLDAVSTSAATTWTSLQNMVVQYQTSDGISYFRPDNWARASNIVNTNTRLTFVRLDRTIVAVDPTGTESVDPGVPPRRVRRRPDPLENVIRVTSNKYLEYRNAVEEIKDTALRETLRLNFHKANLQLGDVPKEKQLRTQLAELQRRVESSQIISDVPHIRESIDQFFKEFQDLVGQAFKKESRRTGRRTLQEESVELILNFRTKQIEELLRIFEAEQTKTAEAFSAIRHYLAVANRFLSETGKVLGFSPTYELGFSIPTLQKRLIEERPEFRSLKELSSGEKQILIVLTYLAFLAGDNSTFVIDEPELSLHVTWQRYLTGALLDVRPKGSQIILATHAPEIAGRAPSNCVILRPEYFGPQSLDATA